MNVSVYGDVHVHVDDNKGSNDKGSAELAVMKKAVKKRDEHKCVICGEKDKQLQVHHIFPQSKYPDLVHDTGNMVTLCQMHHQKYHDKYEGVESAVNFALYMKEESR